MAILLDRTRQVRRGERSRTESDLSRDRQAIARGLPSRRDDSRLAQDAPRPRARLASRGELNRERFLRRAKDRPVGHVTARTQERRERLIARRDVPAMSLSLPRWKFEKSDARLNEIPAHRERIRVSSAIDLEDERGAR